MSEQKSGNTFTELNSDLHPYNVKSNMMTDAVNATLTTKGDNQFILQNMEGNEWATQLTPGFQPLGLAVIKNICYIVSGRFDNAGNFLEGEFGTYPSPDWSNLLATGLNANTPQNFLPMLNKYQPLYNFMTDVNLINLQTLYSISNPDLILNEDKYYQYPFRTPLLDFANDRLIEVELQDSYDGSINIIITDDKNPMRLVNSRFIVSEDGKSAALADRRQTKDTNTYSEARFSITKLIRNSDKIVYLQPGSAGGSVVKNGGSLPGGNYKMYFKYQDSDGALSDLIEESRVIPVSFSDHGAKSIENTGKYIEFELSNLDRKFSGVKVYYSYATGDTEPVSVLKEIINPYDIPSVDPMVIRIYGTELIKDISRSDLNADYSSIDTVKTITQHDDRLVSANITNNNDNLDLLKEISQQMTIIEANDQMLIKPLESGYADPNNVYNKLGLWAGETYEIGIVYILTKGRGTTPVFPVRGLDNYLGTGIYTTGLITEADGFKTSSPCKENRLGVYRTHKKRTMLKGGLSTLTNGFHKQGDTTEVRYIYVNTSILSDPSSPYRTFLDNEIDGCFIVRKERKKDCIMQGIMTNTASVTTGTVTDTNPPYYLDRSNIGPIWTWAIPGGHLRSIREGIGLNAPYCFGGGKIIPAPGRLIETAVTLKSGNYFNNASAAKPSSGSNPEVLNIQGKVFPDPATLTWVDGGATKKTDLFYAFYSPDLLADPKYAASLFNGSSKGISLNNEPVVMKHMLDSAASAAVSPPGTSFPYIYSNKTSPTSEVATVNAVAQALYPNSTAFTDARRVELNPLSGPYTGAITLSEAIPVFPAVVGVIGGQFNFRFRDTNGVAGISDPVATARYMKPTIQTYTPTLPSSPLIKYYEPADLTVNISIDTTGNITGTVQTNSETGVSGGTTAFPITETCSIEGQTGANTDVTGTLVTRPTAGTNNVGTFTIVINYKIKGSFVQGSTTTTLTPVTGTITLTGTFSLSSVSTPGPSVNITSAYNDQKVIKVLTLDNFDIDPDKPTNFVTNSTKNYFQYINEYQDGFTGGQFSAISSRAQYFYGSCWLAGGGAGNVWEKYPLITPIPNNIAFIANDNIRYGDYIGIRVVHGNDTSTANIPQLTTNLKNELKVVTNYRGTGKNQENITGQNHTDFLYRTQFEGIRFGVPVNIYESPSGALNGTNDDWKNKYANINTTESYFATTNRIPLQILKAVHTFLSSSFIASFGGDCFINYTYKRAWYSLGIDSNPTANDASLYYDGNRDTSFTRRGLVFAMVCESNYNLALRGFELKDLIETGLYGKQRTFYPIDNIDTLRSSRQLESKGYNFGYNYLKSDKNHVALNDRAPAYNLAYDTRVLVSSVAVSGSFKNGYTDFSGLNYRDYAKNLGPITKVVSHNGTLFCIQESGVSVIPMNQRTMVSEQQGGIYLDNAQLLGQKLQIISTEYGSNQQFSILKTDGFVYGCDFNKNKIWKIVGAGGQYTLELISDFAVQKILNEYKKKIQNNGLNPLVKANYDRQRNNVIFTFFNIEKGKFITDLIININAATNSLHSTSLGDRSNSENITLQETPVDSEEFTSEEIEAVIIPGEEIVRTPALSTLYYNETLGKWISRLSWNPLFMFNLGNELYSFNGIAEQEKIWKHFSTKVPLCNFYGKQEKFEFEFILVENPTVQKILNNFLVVCNRVFPNRIKFTIDNDVNFDDLQTYVNNHTQLMRQRHEPFNYLVKNIINTSGKTFLAFDMSVEEAERLNGSYFIFNNVTYVFSNYTYISNQLYIEILDQNLNIVPAVPANIAISRVEFGIFKQNMEYIEDHLYIEVGKEPDSSRIRDKAIRIRFTYEGMDYVTIQQIISLFDYSFS